MGINRIIHTAGNGLWSDEERAVKVRAAKARFIFDPSEVSGTWGELRVYFDRSTWRPDRHGLIYTDKRWLREFREILAKKGFSKKACSDVDYSEQGMQGNNYVSMDIGNAFYQEWKAKRYSYEKEIM